MILKTLGATRAQIRAAWLTEFGLVGAGGGVIAARSRLGGELWGDALHYAHGLDFPAGTLIYTLAGALALMLLFGYAGTAAALRAQAGATPAERVAHPIGLRPDPLDGTKLQST